MERGGAAGGPGGSSGNVALRVRTSTRVSRVDYWANNGRWEAFLTHLDGDRWAPVIPLPASVGRNGMRAVIAVNREQVYMAWATDGRLWTNARYGDLDIYTTALPVNGNAARFENGKPIEAGAPAANPNPHEPEDVRRVRAYRYT